MYQGPSVQDATSTKKHVYKGSMCHKDEVYKDTIGTGIKKSSVQGRFVYKESCKVRQKGIKFTRTICAKGT